jgi:hypothetical protein
LFAAIELRVNDYSSVQRKSLHGQVIGQIGCFARGGTCVRAALRVNSTRQFRRRRRGPSGAHLLPLSPLRCSAASHLSRSRHLLPREKSTLALRDGGTGSWVGCVLRQTTILGKVAECVSAAQGVVAGARAALWPGVADPATVAPWLGFSRKRLAGSLPTLRSGSGREYCSNRGRGAGRRGE